jgi:hypothetical protein
MIMDLKMLCNELFISPVSVISQNFNHCYDNYVISLFLFCYDAQEYPPLAYTTL